MSGVIEWVDPHRFLSFHKPPDSIIKEYRVIEKGGSFWPEVKEIDGIWSFNLASELIRKSLIVRCHQKGLQYCPTAGLLYFPPNLLKNNRLTFTRPDDKSKTYVLANNQRKHPSGGKYLYSLAPDFFVRQNLLNDFTVLIRIRVRLSDTTGKPLKGHRTIVSRRKHLCKNWYNKEWFNRTLAVSQFLADDGKIIIGESQDAQDAQIIIDTTPFCINAPVGINEERLGEIRHDQNRIA